MGALEYYQPAPLLFSLCTEQDAGKLTRGSGSCSLEGRMSRLGTSSGLSHFVSSIDAGTSKSEWEFVGEVDRGSSICRFTVANPFHSILGLAEGAIRELSMHLERGEGGDKESRGVLSSTLVAALMPLSHAASAFRWKLLYETFSCFSAFPPSPAGFPTYVCMHVCGPINELPESARFSSGDKR